MSTQPGDLIQFQFNLFLPTAPFSLADPDTDTDFIATLVRNGIATDVTMTPIKLSTGTYRVSLTVPSNWVRGDEVEVSVLTTISSTTNASIVWRATLSARPAQVITSQQLASRGNPDHFGGAQVRAKRPTIQIRAGYLATVEHTLLQDGRPFPFSDYGFSDSEFGGESEPTPQIKAVITELHGCDGREIFVDLLDSDTAQVAFEVPADIAGCPGIWIVEFYVLTQYDEKVFVTDAYLYIERNGGKFTGPPTIAEVRLFLRDFAQENELLDVVDFDGTEIAFAADMCVCEWNEMPPPDGPTYSTQTFPYRRNWLIGICAYLFSIASDHYARNSMDYQAGGVSTDDKNKAMLYAQKAQAGRAEWQSFARERRMIDSINGGGYAEIPGCMGGWW